MTGPTNILAVLNLIETAHSVLATSGLLAERLKEARIGVLHIRAKVDPSFMPTEEVMTENRERAFQAKEDERSSDLKGILDAWQRETGRNAGAAWREVIGERKPTIATEGSHADLIVIGRAGQSHDASAYEAIQAVLFDAKAPVVIVPETVPHTVGRHSAIAWKPSGAADQAIEAALPFLLAAERVTVLIANENGIGDATPQALRASLPQNSVLEIHRFDPGRQSIGDALVREATVVGADLLIMGAYTHRRFMESLLGGATRDILADAGLPVLMHH